MKSNIYHILCISILGWHLHASAQQDNSMQIRMLSDQSVYITGEEIWVDGFIAKGKSESKTIMVRIADRKGVTKMRGSLLLEQGQFSGTINLPETLATDYYFLDAWISGETSETYLLPLMVINPRISFDKGCESKSQIQSTNQNPGTFQINIPKNSFEKREEVEIVISGENNLAINQWSVVREDALSQLANNDATNFNTSIIHPANSKSEKEGHVLGVRVRAEGKPVAGIKIIASLKGKKAVLGSATSDANGIAYFLLPINSGKTELSFTAKTPGINSLVFEPLGDEMESNSIVFPCLLLKEEMKSDIEARIFNSRIATKFQQDGIKYFTASDKDSSDFYGKPDSKYLLDEYVRFPNMEEVISEIIPDVRIKKDGDKSILQVLNIPTRNFFAEEALILVDGIPINKTKEILESDPLLIRSIEVVSRKYSLANIEFLGIVHFKTYKGDMGSFRNSISSSIPFIGIQENSVHQSPAYQREKLPDFRNLIAREKNIRFDNGGKAILKFKTSDAEGSYKFKFIGITPSGEFIQTAVIFKVN